MSIKLCCVKQHPSDDATSCEYDVGSFDTTKAAVRNIDCGLGFEEAEAEMLALLNAARDGEGQHVRGVRAAGAVGAQDVPRQPPPRRRQGIMDWATARQTTWTWMRW